MAKRRRPGKLAKRVTAKRSPRKGEPLVCKKTVPNSGSPKKRRLDILKGQITVPPEFFEPLPEEELRFWSTRAVAPARELERINAGADRLNAGAEEAIGYQAPEK